MNEFFVIAYKAALEVEQKHIARLEAKIAERDRVIVEALQIAANSEGYEGLDYLYHMARELGIVAPNDSTEVQYG
jgi:hypothetical protein